MKLSFFFHFLLVLDSFVSCVTKLFFSHQFIRDLCTIDSFDVCFTNIFLNLLLIVCMYAFLSYLYILNCVHMYVFVHLYMYICLTVKKSCFYLGVILKQVFPTSSL